MRTTTYVMVVNNKKILQSIMLPCDMLYGRGVMVY